MAAPAAPSQATRLLNVAVNGIAASCAEGGRVLDAVRSAGVNVPTLCYDERVGPRGTCRACLVEVELPEVPGAAGAARKQTVAACTWLASDGLKIATHTDAIRDYRRTLLELLLSETASPASCPRCNTTGQCELHAACHEYGARWDQFKRLMPRDKADDPNPFIQRDYDYCIACYRCTNMCNEWEQAAAITVQGRGQHSRIASAFNNLLLESPCTFCGQCINTCPTGALSDRKTLISVRSLQAALPEPVLMSEQNREQTGTRQPGAPEGSPRPAPAAGAPDEETTRYARPAAALKRTKTICPYCGVGCGIHLLSAGGNIAGVEPDFAAPSRGSLCVKGQFASWEFVRSEDRLKYPLIRVTDRQQGARSSRSHQDEAVDLRAQRSGGPASDDSPATTTASTFRRATWDEALDLVAAKFKQTVAQHGPDAVVCWASARVVTEANYLMQKFARVAIGTNNIDNCSRT